MPTTRDDLLARLGDPADGPAWDEFAAIYRPVICRFARKRGLQSSDAEDLAQNVLSAVAARVADWRPDPARSRFRTWLLRVAHNQTVTMYRRRCLDPGRGGTSAMQMLQQQSDDETDLRLDYRREAFRQLARRVRCEFEETSWQAFWLTAVDDRPAVDVAQSLGMSVGAVYTARSRIFRRLQELSQEFEDLHLPGRDAE